MDLAKDVELIRECLQPVARRATSLPWAKKQPWRPETHVWVEGHWPVVNLHDLSVRLGVAVVDALAATQHDFEVGGVLIIVGRGSHTAGHSKLRDAVLHRAGELARENGWRLLPGNTGRVRFIWNPANAPGKAVGRVSRLVWIMVGLYLAAMVYLLVSWIW